MSSKGLHPTMNDLPEEIRVQVIEILNHSLASALDLKTQVRQAHWNVKGPHFIQLHELFDTLATEMEDFVDTIAERVTTLGGTAYGTARMAVAASILPEYPADIREGQDHVQALAVRYAAYGKLIRENIGKTNNLGDVDTADLYTGISRAVDKDLWFLESHLQ